jgi:glycosyltransferase involved in cell wall biosynthesis
VAVVHCGLDHASYRVDPAVPKNPRPTILFVGRVRRYKGVDWVARALPEVLRRIPDARLEVVGDGPHLPELRERIARAGLDGAVEFAGFVPRAEKVRRLQSAWVVVQPSPKEGWGLTVVEAGACGTAVVAADSPGLRDSVRRDETGLLVPFADDAGLSDALSRVLGDADLRRRLEQNGVEWARQFDWGDCARRSLDALLPATGAPSA